MKEFCDWCQGGANDLIYDQNDDRVSGEIDEETGVISVYFDGVTIGSRKVNYCPMCGRQVGRAF